MRMTGESSNGYEEVHEGDKYLAMLGLEDLADVQIPGYDKQGRDFLDICGEHARPLLVGYESLDQNDPRRERLYYLLRAQVEANFKPQQSS